MLEDNFDIDAASPLPGMGAGLVALPCTDRRSGRADLMALLCRPGRPARARALLALTATTIEGVMTPLAHDRTRAGPNGATYAVVCPCPAGPSLAAAVLTPGGERWTETELIERVLRPVALALDRLAARGVTHRAIRPDNVFLSRQGLAQVGPAWAAPAASLQPAAFEPPESAMCLSEGRGEGGTADDVYALGVLLLALAIGRVPMEGIDARTALRRKLDLGSYAALVGDEKLPASIADLARGMLAEDPLHRPPPALLADPPSARARRVAARPPRRAARALDVGDTATWDARSLAFAIATQPAQGIDLLRAGAVDRWLRRYLGDGAMAIRIEEAVRQRMLESADDDARADALLGMRAVALLDPLTPLCWRGVIWWPDGTGTALAATLADADGHADLIEQALEHEAAAGWAALRGERCDEPLVRAEARQSRALLFLRGPASGRARLLYTLNALLPCSSPVLAGHCVTRLSDLLPSLEQVAADLSARAHPPIDADIAAFIAARSEQMTGGLATDTRDAAGVGDEATQLRQLAGLQVRLAAGPLPALAAWLADQAKPLLSNWRGRTRRAAAAARLTEIAAAGDLSALLAVIEDPAGRAADDAEARIAAAKDADVRAELAALTDGGAARAEMARRVGQELAVSLGVAALAGALVLMAVG